MNISPIKLIRQAETIKRWGYRLVTMSEMLSLDGENCVAITLDDGYSNNYQNLFPLLKKKNIKCTIYLAPKIDNIDKLNQKQIQEMYESGLVEFGAHTMTHVNLRNTSDEQAFQEIVDSKRAVEALTRAPCESFSYPYGRYDERHVAMVQRAGFTSAVTVKKTIQPITDPFRLPRIGISGAANAFQFYLAFTRGRYRL